MVVKKILICLLLFSTLFSVGCSSKQNSKDTGNTKTAGDETLSHTAGPTSTVEIDTEFHPIEYYEDRESWNITMEYLRYDKHGIWVNIQDNDGVGFYYNPNYFILEYRDGNNWTKISTLHEENTMYDEIAIVPCKIQWGYANTHSICNNRFIDQSKLVSGHYRLTMVLSRREFQMEFDLNLD